MASGLNLNALPRDFDLLAGLPLGLNLRAPQFETSDTARRILDNLRLFVTEYQPFFHSFVEAEVSRAVPQPTGTGHLMGRRPRMSPAMLFDSRLATALKEAKVQAKALEEEVIIACGSQELVSQGYVAVAPALAPLHVQDVEMADLSTPVSPVKGLTTPLSNPTTPQRSPSKARSSRDATGEPGAFSEKLRTAVHPYSTESRLRAAAARKNALLGHTSPTKLGSSDPAGPLSDTANNVFLSPEKSTRPGTTRPLEPPSPAPWKAEAAVPVARRYISVVPKNPYQGFLNQYRVLLHVQLELEYMLQEAGLGWDKLKRKELECLVGTAAEVGPRLLPLVRHAKKRNSGTAESDDDGPVELAGAADSKRTRVWEEVDREEADLASGENRRLYNESPDWPYGGRLSYGFTVVKPDIEGPTEARIYTPRSGDPTSGESIPMADMQLADASSTSGGGAAKRPAKSSRGKSPGSLGVAFKPFLPDLSGRSFRLARWYGSRRVLSFRIQTYGKGRVKGEDLVGLFTGRILLVCGRTFRALWAAPDGRSFFAVETNDPLPPQFPPRSTDGLLSLQEILARFNDLSQMSGQAMAKWAARPQILFTDTIPVARVDAARILIVDDIVSSHASNQDDPATEELLTDGCGLMSEELASRVYQALVRLNLDPSQGRPSAIQMRIGGAKGMLAVMSPRESKLYPGIDVVLRKSMVKAQPSANLPIDPSMLILDLVKWKVLKLEVPLSSEPTIMLRHNGVPESVLVKMCENSLTEVAQAFSTKPNEDETESDALRRLIANVHRFGGIGASRRRRDMTARGLSLTVSGLSMRSEQNKTSSEDTIISDEDAEDDGGDLEDSGSAGAGISKTEQLYMALCAGACPKRTTFASTQLRYLVENLCDKIVGSFRLPVKASLSSFVVPDSQEILAPNEIFVSFSGDGPVNPITGYPMMHIEGEVLVVRSPCKLATDVRKYSAVYRPELAHLRDVVVMSASSALCALSPMSLHAGGDYDGDTVNVYWDRELVDSFTDTPAHEARVAPGFIQDHFVKGLVRGEQFLRALEGSDEETQTQNVQRFLLGGLEGQDLVGKYSNLHACAVYRFGVTHPDSVRLAHVFCHVLDARKSGLQIRPEILSRDVKQHDGLLEWLKVKKQADTLRIDMDERNRREFTADHRPKHLGRHIMDCIMTKGRLMKGKVLNDFPKYFPSPHDLDILQPFFRRAQEHAELTGVAQLEHELDLVKRHVEACHSLWSRIRNGQLGASPSVRKQYLDIIESGFQPRTMSPVKTPSRNGSMTGKTVPEVAAIKRAQSAQLARIWAVYPGPADLPNLTRFGDLEPLQKLKVSYAASMNKYNNDQTFVFEVDFTTTCSMFAKAKGATVTCLSDVQQAMKPALRTQ